jgi:hypothetical protein
MLGITYRVHGRIDTECKALVRLFTCPQRAKITAVTGPHNEAAFF